MSFEEHLGLAPLATAIPRKRPRAAKPPGPSEAQVQNSIRHALVMWGCYVQVISNEARASGAQRGVRTRGAVSGHPDLLILGPDGRSAHLEVKVPGWRPSKNTAHHARQAETRERIAKLGHVTGIVTSIDDTRTLLRAAGWSIP